MKKAILVTIILSNMVFSCSTFLIGVDEIKPAEIKTEKQSGPPQVPASPKCWPPKSCI